MKTLFQWIRDLKVWVENFAQKPGASWMLFLVAFAESSFFPIPPDVLLIALAVLMPKKGLYYAAICSVGSVLGGMFGYLLGYQFFELIGAKIIRFYGVEAQYQYVQTLFSENAFVSIAVAGFTPIPYKVFTIAAGAFDISFSVFVYASVISRSARFFIVASLFYFFGPQIKPFIDKHFELLTVVFVVLLVLGFVVIKWIL